MNSQRFLFLPILLLPLIWISASTAGEPMHWAGCDIAKHAFMKELAQTYRKLYGTEIILEGGGDDHGYSQVHAQNVELGGACRSKMPQHPAEARVRQTPIAWDALVVMVHRDNPVSDISLNQLHDLYEGRITNWQQLGGEDRPVALVAREGKTSGVGHSIRKLIFGDPEKELAAGKLFASSEPLEKEIETNPDAIGMSGISSARKRDLKILSLEGKTPGVDNIKSGEYLLYRPLYITYSNSNPRRKEVKQFIKLANSSMGRKIIKAQGVVPYLEASKLVLKQREQWKSARKLATSESE